MEMMDLIECSLCIGWCSLGLFQRYFRRKIGGKSYNRVLGGGCESDERGVSDPAGRPQCHTITIPSDSISQKSIGEVEG